MENTYQQTYHYMLEAIESGKIYSLSRFNQIQKEEILRLFISEASADRLMELNDDYFPEISLEVAFLYPHNKNLRAISVDILWGKYGTELDKIFEQAESDDYKSTGIIGEYEEWRNEDLRQRLRDAA